jgi:hypothetical protein
MPMVKFTASLAAAASVALCVASAGPSVAQAPDDQAAYGGAVTVYKTDLPPLATIGGVPVTGGGYGSSLAPAPHGNGIFYGLTDRGPNVDGPDGTKVEPLPDFQPAIGEFKLAPGTGEAVLLRRIGLTAPDGTPYSGRANCHANTGETILDLDGKKQPCDSNGYDSEGLVAAKDGTFWVSDEYGPFITHFDRSGRQIGRLSPFEGTLPAELRFREPNRGLEGLTITPDGTTLVGMMQSALTIDPGVQTKSKNIPFTRLVTYNLRTGETHEYAYVLKDFGTVAGLVNSEITALSDDEFLVDTRDGKFAPGAYKKVFKIDINGATDIGPSSPAYDPALGYLVNGKPLEDLFTEPGQASQGMQVLQAAGITPVKSSLHFDLGAFLTRIDPTGGFFGHDKIEGLAAFDGGKTLVFSNDSDFGIDGVTNTTPPFQLRAKILPNGKQDDGEFLVVHTDQLP